MKSYSSFQPNMNLKCQKHLTLLKPSLLVFAVLDIGMIISLIRPGDERKQLIVWKASTYTLLVTVLVMAADIIVNVSGLSASSNSYMQFPMNTFIRLELVAIAYFIAFLFFRKKYGD